MNSKPVSHFLKAVRRRLWLEAALRQLRFAAWTASLTLAVLALAHLAGRPSSLVSALAAASIVGLLSMLPALQARPPLTECAIRADRHFKGRALLTTVQEIRPTSDLRPAERTALARARSAIATWSPRLGEIWQAPPRRGYALAVIPAFFAILVLELPASDAIAEKTVVDDPAATERPAPETTLLGNADDLAEVRDAIVRGATEERLAANSERRTGDGATQAADARSLQAPAELDAAEQGQLAPATAGSAKTTGVEAGDAASVPPGAGQDPDTAPPGFAETALAAIERRGNRASGRRATGDAYANALTAPDASNLDIAPVPAPAAESAWTALTTTELGYARRYLALKDQNDE